MSLTVTRARVKERCGIADTSQDATIDNLIAEIVPAVEFAIEPGHVADTGNVGLQANLNLAALEVVCGEFMAQRVRAPGFYHATVSAGVESRPLWSDPSDPGGQKAQGMARLAPYLKRDPTGLTTSLVSGSSIGKNPREDNLPYELA